jgi:hypothetical protein
VRYGVYEHMSGRFKIVNDRCRDCLALARQWGIRGYLSRGRQRERTVLIVVAR